MSGLIVHEWAERSGGAEQVLDQILQEFPDADLKVLWNDAIERYPAAHESWLARTPLRRSKMLALPFMIPTWRKLTLGRDYDWMLVSSHLFAHHAKSPSQRDLPKFVYAHTPARYIWEPQLDSRGNNPFVRAAAAALKPLDRHRAQEATAIAANSNFTRERVRRVWDREATVIFPPVDTAAISAITDWSSQISVQEESIVKSLPDSFLLGASRFVPYKRLDLVIQAGSAIGMPVVIAGSGPDEARLREIARSARIPVTFILNPSTPLLRTLYQSSTAYVFPAIEDFGIMPIEAMAAGTPVIVPHEGGAAESVALTGGGTTFFENTPQAWRTAFSHASAIDRSGIRKSASVFSNQSFRDSVREWVSDERSS